jgi:hypothetical protein
MTKTQPKDKKESKDKNYLEVFGVGATILGAIISLYTIINMWNEDRVTVSYLLVGVGLVLVAAVLCWWSFFYKNGKNSKSHRRATIALFITWFIVFLIWLIMFIIYILTSNILYGYFFEPNDAENSCWRMRLGKNQGISFNDHANYWGGWKLIGRQSMQLDVDLQGTAGSGQTLVTQVDACKKGSPACTGAWYVPHAGRIQAWVCLPPANIDNNVILAAELFLVYSDDAKDCPDDLCWNASSPVTLTPGQWTLVRWDADHDPNATWRDWPKEFHGLPAIALGMEIKFDENSLPDKAYQGPVYIDEFVVTSNREAYNLFMPNDRYTKRGGCPSE